MDKPTIELIRFDASDVIATSGPVTLTVSKFKNGEQGDLFITFGNATYNGYFQKGDFLSALEGYTSTTNLNPQPSGEFDADLLDYFEADNSFDVEGHMDNLADGINGTYTWYNNMWNWTRN